MQINRRKMLSALVAAPLAARPAAHSFGIRGDRFVLDGAPFVIRSGEMHYARIPREYWRDRMKKMFSRHARLGQGKRVGERAESGPLTEDWAAADLFLPGVWLKKGRNEIIVLDLVEGGERSLAGVKDPVWETPAS